MYISLPVLVVHFIAIPPFTVAILSLSHSKSFQQIKKKYCHYFQGSQCRYRRLLAMLVETIPNHSVPIRCFRNGNIANWCLFSLDLIIAKSFRSLVRTSLFIWERPCVSLTVFMGPTFMPLLQVYSILWGPKVRPPPITSLW